MASARPDVWYAGDRRRHGMLTRRPPPGTGRRMSPGMIFASGMIGAHARTSPGGGAAWARLRTPVFLVLALAAACFLHLRSANVPDPDSFYHLRHAALYASNGLFVHAFPWLPMSVFATCGSDIWYGYHLALIPFTRIADPVLAIKIPGILLTVFLLWSVYAVARRHGLSKPGFWPFLLLASGPNVMFHFTMTRPHVLTTALCALLFSCLLVGSAPAVFLLAFAIAFSHLSLVWIIPAILVVILTAKAAIEKVADWRTAIAAILGVVAGWLLRPNPWGAAELAWVQIGRLAIEKMSGVPLLVGTELLPITGQVVLLNFVPFTVLWIAALATAPFALGLPFAARGAAPSAAGAPSDAPVSDPSAVGRGSAAGVPPRMRSLIWSSLALSILFCVQMFVVARRSFAPWALFGVILIAAIYTSLFDSASSAASGEERRGRRDPARPGSDLDTAPHTVPQPKRHEWRLRRFVSYAGPVLFAGMAIYAVLRSRWLLENAYAPGDYREAAEWIAAHSAPGEIVYNVHWDTFPKLFLWNQKNHYTRGMDPIFEYAFDPSHYYKGFYLHIGKATALTCGVPTCTRETLEDTLTVLRRDFRASWLFIEKDRSPALDAYARSDARFVLAWENPRQVVFDLREPQTRDTRR